MATGARSRMPCKSAPLSCSAASLAATYAATASLLPLDTHSSRMRTSRTLGVRPASSSIA